MPRGLARRADDKYSIALSEDGGAVALGRCGKPARRNSPRRSPAAPSINKYSLKSSQPIVRHPPQGMQKSDQRRPSGKIVRSAPQTPSERFIAERDVPL